jgi:hypothetical protein
MFLRIDANLGNGFSDRLGQAALALFLLSLLAGLVIGLFGWSRNRLSVFAKLALGLNVLIWVLLIIAIVYAFINPPRG